MPAATSTYFERVKSMLRSRDPKVRELVKRANEEILSMKALSPGQVHNNGTLSNISVQYKNESFIGVSLLPVAPVAGDGKYFKYGKRDRLATPDDKVSVRSKPNEINETRTTGTVATQGYALEEFLDDEVMRRADAPLNEMVDLIQSVNDVMDFAEEKRIATIMTTAGNFPGQTAALAAADRWDSASGGNPVKDIQDARSLIWQGMGRTKVAMYSPRTVFNVLSRHPAILDLFKNVTSGLATRDMIAAFFECDEYLVGSAWEDTANINQAAVYSRIWGTNTFGIARVATGPSIRTACAGFTFRFGEKKTTQWYDPEPGVSGGYYGKVGMSEEHHLVAPDTCYLLTTVTG